MGICDIYVRMFSLRLSPEAAWVLARRKRGRTLYLPGSGVSAAAGLNKWTSPGVAAAHALPGFRCRISVPRSGVNLTKALAMLAGSPGTIPQKLAIIEAAQNDADILAGDDALSVCHSRRVALDPAEYGSRRDYEKLFGGDADPLALLPVIPAPVVPDEGPDAPARPVAPALRAAAATIARSTANTAVGIAAERGDLAAHGISQGSQQRYTHTFCGPGPAWDPVPLHVSCAVDGLLPTAGCPQGVIVESKRRMRYFRGMPLEECVQMETYMCVQAAVAGPGAGYCIHIESCGDEARQSRYPRSGPLRGQITRGLERFFTRLAAALALPTVAFVHGEVVLPELADCPGILAQAHADCPPCSPHRGRRRIGRGRIGRGRIGRPVESG